MAKTEKDKVDLPDGNDEEVMGKKRQLYSLGEKGFFLIVFLSALILMAWVFSLNV